MKRFISFSYVIMLMVVAFGIDARYKGTVKFVNKSNRVVRMTTLNKPFGTRQAERQSLIALNPDESVDITVRGPILGWVSKGVVDYSVIDATDRIIFFVGNSGKIKTVHGMLEPVNVSNTQAYPITLETEKPPTNTQDCYTCAETCNAIFGSLDYCECLEWCWDYTQDLHWRLRPGDTMTVKAAKGTKIKIFEDDLDDDEKVHYYCESGNCS